MIALRGVRVATVELTRTEELGAPKMTGAYELISDGGKVLAKQNFNGYNDIKIEPSADTADLLQRAMAAISKDVERVLGITAEAE